MHRDKRLGLALGILLLGTVGAFFFRNEGEPMLSSPELENPAKLDGQIAENPVGPYLTGLEEDDEPKRSPAQGVSQSSAGDDAPWGTPDFLQRKRANPDFPGASGPPSPIATRAATVGGIPIPRENDAWEPISIDDKPKQARKKSRKTTTRTVADGYVIHKVRNGDTLSDLAQRYLGSSARFREIYEANHNVLRSPDDLKLGSMIRIPTSTAARPNSGRRANRIETRPVSNRNVKTAQPKPASKKSVPEKVTAPATSAKPKKKMFIPVRRSPLMPRGVGKRASAADVPVDEIPRQLTQLPPEKHGSEDDDEPVKEASAVEAE